MITVEEIMQELAAHTEAIGAPPRDRDRLRRDAEWVMNTREGLRVETLCMILTDYEFALTAARAASAPSPGAHGGTEGAGKP